MTNYNPGDLLSSFVSPSLTSEGGRERGLPHARAALSQWISARDLNHKLPRSLCKNIKRASAAEAKATLDGRRGSEGKSAAAAAITEATAASAANKPLAPTLAIAEEAI